MEGEGDETTWEGNTAGSHEGRHINNWILHSAKQ